MDDRVSTPGRVRERNFFLHRVQTCSETHPASYPMGTGRSYPWIKRLDHEADRSLPPSAEDKNVWSYTSIPLFVFMAWCLTKKGAHLHGVVRRF
jgi:hypothetical protein